MKNHIDMTKKLTLSFLAIETAIFLIYMISDLFFSAPEFSNVVKFIGIVLCPIYALIMMIIRKNEDRLYTCIIFTLTVFADVFLLLENIPLPGVIIFSVVQNIYMLWFISIKCRLPGKNEIIDRSGRKPNYFKHVIWHFLFRIFVSALLLLLISLSRIQKDTLIYFTVFYAVSFFDNLLILISILIKKRYRDTGFHVPLLLVGMLLFMLCDISVALYNMKMYFAGIAALSPTVFSIVSITMWFFYLPSQVILTLIPDLSFTKN